MAISEIEKRAPWYQRIEFPQHGITTTDRPERALNDSACDNLFPGVDPVQAPILRPIPKYERLKPFLPDVTRKTVLEIGTSCGFFAFEFCRRGAKEVTAMDLDAGNIERGSFCASVLGLPNVRFIAGDVGEYNEAHDVLWGSSLHEHFFFPFYYFARLLCLARETLVLETHHYVKDDQERIVRLDFSYAITPKSGAHAFHFSRLCFVIFFSCSVFLKRASKNGFLRGCQRETIVLCVDTRSFQ